MNTLYQQMQQDVIGTANNMVTQMVCAEKGIDYNQLMYNAQQQHLNNIMQAEQQRQMQQLVKRHYQGNSGSFISKIKDVFVPDQAQPFIPMPNMVPTNPYPVQQVVQQPMPYQQQVQQVQPMYQQSPQQVAHIINEPQTNDRLDMMENKINGMEQMLTTIVASIQQNTQQPQIQAQPNMPNQNNQG